MIHVDQLVRKYGITTAVDGISFDISRGEVVGFLGPNGAGKTTTLKILAGFLWPSSGTVTIFDKDVMEHSLECRRMIGYLPENNPIYEDMEVCEYLGWCAQLRGMNVDGRRQAMRRVIDRCGLGQVVGKDIGELSKGYRQRVGLAAAMVQDPPILLLDEPTSGLDPNQAVEVRDLIAELRKEKTVLLSTHILSEVQASCDRVIIIHKGRIAAQGTPQELGAAGAREQRIHLVLRSKNHGTEKGVKEKLSSLPGVVSVEAEDKKKKGELALSIEVEADADDLREEIFHLAAEKKWPMLELYRESRSLEDVFRSLTA